MKQFEMEQIQNQAIALDVDIVVTHVEVQRFSVTIGKRVFNDFHKALSALTTVYLKDKK